MSVALGVNFIHRLHVKKAAEEFSEERYRHDPYDQCYPHFPRLLFTHIASLMRYIIIFLVIKSLSMIHVVLYIVCLK